MKLAHEWTELHRQWKALLQIKDPTYGDLQEALRIEQDLRKLEDRLSQLELEQKCR